MNSYFDLDGNFLGRGWALATCHKAEGHEDHDPHTHNPMYSFYGPYMCEGYPKTEIYSTRDRKPENP